MHKHRHVCAHTYLSNQHCMIILSFSEGLEILKHSDNLCLPMGSQPLGWHLVYFLLMLMSIIYFDDQRGCAMH